MTKLEFILVSEFYKLQGKLSGIPMDDEDGRYNAIRNYLNAGSSAIERELTKGDE